MTKKRTARQPHYVDEEEIIANARNEDQRKFALTLNRLLHDKGIHQDSMAEDLGISTGSLSKYRAAKQEPCVSTLVKIANYLDVDCHYLMTGVASNQKFISDEYGLNSNSLASLQKLVQAKDEKYVPEYIKEAVDIKYQEESQYAKDTIKWYTERIDNVEKYFSSTDDELFEKKYETVEDYKHALSEKLEFFKKYEGTEASLKEDSEIPMFNYFKVAREAISGINLLLSQPKPERLFSLIAMYAFSEIDEDFSLGSLITFHRIDGGSFSDGRISVSSVVLDYLLSEIRTELVSIRNRTSKKYELQLE